MSTLLRPQKSAGLPAKIDPTIVPIKAMATVKPREFSFRPYVVLSASVVPEMTAVSKPKRKPPRAATMALPIRAGDGANADCAAVASFANDRFSRKFTGGPPQRRSRGVSIDPVSFQNR